MEESRGPLFEQAAVLLYRCRRLPPGGAFTVGELYPMGYAGGREQLWDDKNEPVPLPPEVLEACFSLAGEAVTAFSPLLSDPAGYRVYLIQQGPKPGLAEIKAYAALKGVNYLQARQALRQGRNLIAAGTVGEVRDVLAQLARFPVRCITEPAYPHGNGPFMDRGAENAPPGSGEGQGE